MKKLSILLIIIISCSMIHAYTHTITSVMGSNNSTGSGSLTDLYHTTNPDETGSATGWICYDIQWTHTYDVSGFSEIVSATLEMDTLDLDQSAGGSRTVVLTNAGQYIGTAEGGNTGGPDPWYQYGVNGWNGSHVQTYTLDLSNTTIYNNLMSGSFTIFGDHTNTDPWGSNMATLTITYNTVPESGNIILLTIGLLSILLIANKK